MTTTAVTSEPANQTYTIFDREIRLPCVVRNATAAVAFYLVSASAAQKLIAKSGLRIAQMLPGRTICTLGTMNYKDSDLGGYQEVALTFFVHEPGARPLPLISALLGMARMRAGSPRPEAWSPCRVTGRDPVLNNRFVPNAPRSAR